MRKMRVLLLGKKISVPQHLEIQAGRKKVNVEPGAQEIKGLPLAMKLGSHCAEEMMKHEVVQGDVQQQRAAN